MGNFFLAIFLFSPDQKIFQNPQNLYKKMKINYLNYFHSHPKPEETGSNPAIPEVKPEENRSPSFHHLKPALFRICNPKAHGWGFGIPVVWDV